MEKNSLSFLFPVLSITPLTFVDVDSYQGSGPEPGKPAAVEGPGDMNQNQLNQHNFWMKEEQTSSYSSGLKCWKWLLEKKKDVSVEVLVDLKTCSCRGSGSDLSQLTSWQERSDLQTQ